MWGDNFTPPPCWFSLNNSETVKAVTLAFCSIQYIALETFVPNLVSITRPQSADIGQNSEGGISDFWISGQSLINENCHNSRASDDIDMKVGPVTRFHKKNKTTSKNFDNYIMSANCDVLVIFLVYGQFRAIRRPSSGRIVCKTYISININLL